MSSSGPTTAITAMSEMTESGGLHEKLNDCPPIELEHKAEYHQLTVEADQDEERQRTLGFIPACRLYRKAVLWAFMASLSVVMEGFDKGFTSAVLGQKTFQDKFGEYQPHINKNQIPASWQSAITQAPQIGAFLGLWIGGYLNDRYGYRKTMLGMYMFFMPCVALYVFAQNKAMLVSAGITCGITWGSFSTLAEAYASEIAPVAFRAYMTGYINVCWTFGGFIATGVLTGCQHMPGSWSWRLPYATQWIWPIPLIIGFYFAPESPWWLVRHGRLEEAERSVIRLASKDSQERAGQAIANMVRTTAVEKHFANTQRNSRWRDLIRGSDLRRTEITILVWLWQDSGGGIFAGNPVYVLQQAGISQGTAFTLTLAQNGIAVVANAGNYILMYLMGRRRLYMMAFLIQLIIITIIGIMGVYGDRGADWARWVQGGFQMAFNVSNPLLTGPVCYAILGEASSMRLRNKSIAVARMVYAVYHVVMATINSYQINPSAWAWGAKTAFFWIPFCSSAIIWCYFRLPEFKGRSPYEIDLLFERKVSARKFKQTAVELETRSGQPMVVATDHIVTEIEHSV